MNFDNRLLEKWAPVLDHEALPAIKDNYRKQVTAILLENQEQEMRKSREALFEAGPAVNTGGDISALGSNYSTPGTNGTYGYDPVLISLVRRAMPQLIAYDICGVQPMTQPTGLIFAMKSKYSGASGAEALFNEADTVYAGATGASSSTIQGNPSAGGDVSDWYSGSTGVDNSGSVDIDQYGYGVGYTTAQAEERGSGAFFNEMAFSIERTSVVAQTRQLKAEYSLELAQDLKAVHGLDAEAELSNILSQEILAEINREVVRTIYLTAVGGARVGTTNAGAFNLDTDSNGRWSVEKFKGLLFQMEREANAIGHSTRRGRGNFVICSADVASALSMAGVLDYAPALNTNLNVDDTSSTFAGVLNGKYKVYIDPYTANQTANQFFVMGYKGQSAFDAGLFYCPYVPLQQVRAVNPDSFQPSIGFKTRYGMVENPFVRTANSANFQLNSNYYYRRVLVQNLM